MPVIPALNRLRKVVASPRPPWATEQDERGGGGAPIPGVSLHRKTGWQEVLEMFAGWREQCINVNGHNSNGNAWLWSLIQPLCPDSEHSTNGLCGHIHTGLFLNWLSRTASTRNELWAHHVVIATSTWRKPR